MRYDVNVLNVLLVFIVCFNVVCDVNIGIGIKQIDWVNIGFGFFDQVFDVVFIGDIGGECSFVYVCSGFFDVFSVDV